MFKFIGRFLSKVSLAALIREIALDVDTVQRADGSYLRIIVEAFGFTLLDEYIKLSGQTIAKATKHEKLELAEPVNEFRSNSIEKMKTKALARQANDRLAKSLNRGQ